MRILKGFIFTIIMTSGMVWADPWLSNAQTLAAETAVQSNPKVAYNSLHHEYLVVWHSEDAGIFSVRGVRVDGGGSPIGSSFAISEPGPDQFAPDVVYDPAHDRYIVVWISDYSGDLSDTDIAGRFVPWDGPDPAHLSFGINGAMTGQWSPSVAINPNIGEFLVAWCNVETATPSTISVQRWATDGSGSVTPALPITSGPEYRINSKVVWNDEVSQYLVVYERFIGGLEEDVYATRLSWSGSILGSEIGIAGWPAEESQVDVASCRGDYLVVWKGGSGTQAQVYTRSVSGDGSVGTVVSNLSGEFGDQNHPAVICNDSGGEYIVTWEAEFDGSHRGVVAALMAQEGTMKGDSFNVYVSVLGSTTSYTKPGLTFGRSGKALVAWESDRSDFSSQDIRGRLVSGALFADDFETDDFSRWSAVQN